MDKELQELMELEKAEKLAKQGRAEEYNESRNIMKEENDTLYVQDKEGVDTTGSYKESNNGEIADTFEQKSASKEKALKVCSSCGGTLRYKAGEYCLECTFCSATYELNINTDEVVEISLDKIDDIFSQTDWGVETKTVECANCGGKTVSTTDEKTTFCAFCGSQHISVNAEEAGVRPQGLVPYEFSQKAARDIFNKWIKRRWLAPNNLKKLFALKDMEGVYFPYWTFDTNAYSSYSVDVGYKHKDDDGNEYTDWYTRSGTYSKEFDDQLVVATVTDFNKLFKKIEPFNTTGTQVVNYDSTYLVGYKARKYTVDPHEAWSNAQEDIEDDLESNITSNLGGDTYRNFYQTVTYSDNTFKHIVLPIYTLVYDYKGKTYNVLVNGQTGKIGGAAPYSWIKITGIIAIIAAIAYWLWS